MKAHTVNMLHTSSLGNTDGAEVNQGIEVKPSERGRAVILGQYGPGARFEQVCLDRMNPPVVFGNEKSLPMSIVDGHPILGAGHTYIAKPNHDNPHNTMVRISTKTERDLRLTIGKMTSGVKSYVGGHGTAGPVRSRWDDILVTMRPWQSVEIKNGHSAFYVVSDDQCRPLLMTAAEYQEIRPHVEAIAH